jgi:hypothetical protein
MQTMTTQALTIAVRLCAVVAVMTGARAEAQIVAADSTVEEIPSHGPSLVRNLRGVNHGALQIREWRWSEKDTLLRASPSGQNRFGPGPRLMPPPQGRKSSRRSLIARRVVAGVAGGLLGFLGGGLLGSALEGSCACDDPGLAGFLVGAPIGAAVGAVAGVAMIQ